MTAIAILVLVAVAAISIWAYVRRPGNLAGEDFLHVWRFSPWGKQFLLDFGGLEIILALWMVSHALAHDSLLLAIGCIVLMPIFGSMSAAAYWLFRVSM
jgi:hypothetical protein